MLVGVKSVHTYSIGLSFFKKIIEILEAHFTSVNRNKVYLFVLRKISYNLCRKRMF